MYVCCLNKVFAKTSLCSEINENIKGTLCDRFRMRLKFDAVCYYISVIYEVKSQFFVAKHCKNKLKVIVRSGNLFVLDSTRNAP